MMNTLQEYLLHGRAQCTQTPQKAAQPLNAPTAESDSLVFPADYRVAHTHSCDLLGSLKRSHALKAF